MRYLLPIIGALLMAGCSATPLSVEDAMKGGYERDQGGNTYPEPCRQPMICKAEDDCQIGKTRSLVVTLPQSQMPPATKPGETLFGRSYRYGRMIVSGDITGWRRADLIRHELCHQMVGDWHK